MATHSGGLPGKPRMTEGVLLWAIIHGVVQSWTRLSQYSYFPNIRRRSQKISGFPVIQAESAPARNQVWSPGKEDSHRVQWDSIKAPHQPAKWLRLHLKNNSERNDFCKCSRYFSDCLDQGHRKSSEQSVESPPKPWSYISSNPLYC